MCMCVRTHLSPAESSVTCSAGSNLCGGGGDTVAHAEMASFLSANPCVLPHTSSLPADSSTPGVIYQALKQQTKAPRNVRRARDGLIDKHCDSRTKHEWRVNFIMSRDSAWLRSEQYGLSSCKRIKFMSLKYDRDQAMKFLLQVFVAV